MNEENKTFAETTVQPTESESIRERISNYKAQVSPQSVQVAQLLLEQQLKAGLVKSTDLDALIMMRDDLNKAMVRASHGSLRGPTVGTPPQSAGPDPATSVGPPPICGP